MHFFGSNPDPKPPGGLTDIICYFRFHSDSNITLLKLQKATHFGTLRFAVVACIQPIQLIPLDPHP